MIAATIKAFVWLRWRILVNSLERTGARDTLERFSIAVDKLGQVIGLILFIPSSIALGILSVVAGFGLATGSWLMPFEILRYFVMTATVLAFFGPIVLPSRSQVNVVRLLLLPIPRALLYASQVVATLADPWILLLIPVTLGVPLGLAIGLKPLGAIVALLAGAAVLLFVTAASSLVAAIIQLLFRSRRRGEAVMLLLVIVLPLIGMLPSMLQIGSSARTSDASGTRYDRRHSPSSPYAVALFNAGARIAPSELYHRATVSGARRDGREAAPLLGLFAGALLFQAVAFAAFVRMLDMPATLGARRAGGMGGLWERQLPGLSRAASAVAFTQVRLALRTPRGRSIVTAPLLVVAVFGALMLRKNDLPFPLFSSSAGLGLAMFGAAASLLSIMPLALNQFAVDRAGFTRQMLSPLGLGELLAGKAVGNLIVMAIPASLTMLIPAVMFRDGAPALWASLLLGLIATFALTAPVAAALSATFPKVVDLSSIGQASNAHQAAALLGMLAYAVCAAPAAGLALLATRLLARPSLAAVLMLGWCLVALAISWAAFVPVRRFVGSRTENLAHLV